MAEIRCLALPHKFQELQTFVQIIFVENTVYPPSAQRVEIIFTVYGSKLGFSDELELLVQRVSCAEFYAEVFCLWSFLPKTQSWRAVKENGFD